MKIWPKIRTNWRELKQFEQILLIFTAIVTTVIVILFIKYKILFDPRASAIKKYSYSGSVDEFISHVQEFSKKNSNMNFKITDTTGVTETGLRFYLKIDLKNKGSYRQYSLACENRDSKDISLGTTMDMAMAYDSASNTGGYWKEAKGIIPLVSYFDNSFIKPLMFDQDIQIVSP
jgi:hypothetical protein